ncbi:MAG: DUF3052 domain-containing protein [Bacteroidota bacterium]|nr:DUF3052 domain-containing protein [Bacteroidota bacterium]MDP4217502.1 DUF3052 domain-containing protein [Bacteroidota bacterium]MDP4252467.1 DUF3052 domain-containing protein [Bacteroidota bacterium]MDP4256651.1 DUF3052 domain-containing protein [Bacteroidota bacterium]
MANAGYSGTPLLKKLGLQDTHRVWVINEPGDYFRWLEKDISSQRCPAGGIPDWVHLFARSRKEFQAGMQQLKKVYEKNSALIIWVSWYKKSSGLSTDLTEDVIREYALANGLVDIKVCAVSGQWSGLKLVVPVSKRRNP